MFMPARFIISLAGLFLAFSMVTADFAEARRGGSFGSRGSRTFQSAPATRTAPKPAAPIERSTTSAPRASDTARQTGAASRPGIFNGFGGSMLRGLALGGLIGLLLGHGFGGLAGMFGLLVQVLLIGGVVMLLMRVFRAQPAQFGRTAAAGGSARFSAIPGRPDVLARRTHVPGAGSRSGRASGLPASNGLKLSQNDLDVFEQRLSELQDAFGREDHASLRRLATPEMVSFLSEELAGNAARGVRNEVTDVHLMQADVAESWREGDRDYATAALNYASIDVTRNRISGKPVDAEAPERSETTELWTFVRETGGEWQVSAIQQA